jgi:hypothetical protein
MERREPIGSGLEAVGSEELGTINKEAAIPRATIGTLTKKTDPHQKWLSNQPPKIGPTATPTPVVPDHIPIARARS